MSQHAIVQQMIAALGQSQAGRMPAELDAHFVDIDERGPELQLLLTKRFAELVRYYRFDAGAPEPVADGDWSAFFPYDRAEARRLLARTDGKVPPHLALLIAFVKLFELPREAINRLTDEHLTLFYERILGFAPLSAVPDRAHVIVELKKLASTIRVGPEHVLSAGKDKSGVELLYRPVRDTVIGPGRVESLRSIYVDPRDGGVRFAPDAASADGLGAALDEAEPKWRGFGSAVLPAAEVGFALSSPVLRMAQSERVITLELGVSGLDPNVHAKSLLQKSFRALLTGPKGWIGAPVTAVETSGDTLTFEVRLPASEQAVIDWDAALHVQPFAVAAPVVQLVLVQGPSVLPHGAFKDLRVRHARISVEVSALPVALAENDTGPIDPKKAFFPFGAQPVVGSRFSVSCPEALSKALSSLTLAIDWLDPPPSFKDRYAAYSGSLVKDNGYFTAGVAFSDGGTWRYAQQGVKLFQPLQNGRRTLAFSASTPSLRPKEAGYALRELDTLQASWAPGLAKREPGRLRFPSKPPAPPVPDPRASFVTLSLEYDFMHAAFRFQTIDNALKQVEDALPEPYTPAIRGVSLGYRAQSDLLVLEAPSLEAFAGSDVGFFHVEPFGVAREHAFAREQLAFVADKRVPLMAEHATEGELLIGLSGLSAGDSVSLLVQVADASADPELPRAPVAWSVLCDDHFRPLASSELALDTTQGLLVSGSVVIVLPREATAQNTLLPSGLIWLRASVARHVEAVNQLLAVQANAVEVRFEDRGGDPQHLAAPLPKASIAKLKTPIATVKSVRQPYASFGGALRETPDALRMRAAERLRHKQRAVSAWDYERLVLGAFPKVHKVKCIPHAKDGQWLAPGHVLLVVVPDLRNENAKDPLQPKVDAATLAAIEQHVRARGGMFALEPGRVQVRNPRYQKVRADFGVRFRDGLPPNFYARQLEQELIDFLSPWTTNAMSGAAIGPEFGGRVYKSVLLDFVEARAYVDYVTDFKLFSYAGDALDATDLTEARASTPDAILVSDAVHGVRPIVE